MGIPERKTHPYKVCAGCREEKPVTEFSAHRVRKDGLNSYCKPCHRAKVRDWKVRNPEKRRAGSERYNRKLRADVIAGYGGACECCGETTPEFLSVDHIFNDGAAERIELGGNRWAGRAVYQMLRANGYPKERHRLLCHNCNQARQFYGECPHQAFTLRVVS